MSFQKPKALSAASSGITLQEVQVPSIQVWWKAEQGDWIHELVRQKRSFAWALPFCGYKTRAFKSNTTKLSVFKSAFVSILTYGQESWVLTERLLSQVAKI